MTSKSCPFHFTSISDESRAWRYYNPEARRIQTSRNITFISQDELEAGSTQINPKLALEGEQKQQNEYQQSELPPLDSDTINIPEAFKDTMDSISSPPISPASTLTPLPSPSPSPALAKPKAPRDISSAIDTRNILTTGRRAQSGATPNYWLLNNPDLRSPRRPDAWKTRVQQHPDIESNTAVFAFPSIEGASVTESLTVAEARARPD
ncbi:hypothetical protein FB446DRAFT_795471 [Lentinula raphanica]|nr:hypothetical protein FB446DRAFT_795471 [Lentinula raphanica]